jgi:hypothetical protein
LRGVTAVQTEILDRVPSRDLRAYFVWLPILSHDDPAAARASAARHRDPRITHFWDGERALGLSLGRLLALPPTEPEKPRVAWDAYLLYDRGVRWKRNAPPPAPTFWMHQLWGVDKMAPLLDAPVLRTRVEALLKKLR